MCNGANDEIILSLDELKERLENLAKCDDDAGYKGLYSYLTTETPNFTLKINEPNLNLLLIMNKPFRKKLKKRAENHIQKKIIRLILFA